MEAPFSLDRLAMRSRPEGRPVMYQNWDNLLFLHWPVKIEAIRPLIPAELEIDAFDAKAWIGITPFAVTNLRLAGLPRVPGFDAFFELNVRTYVVYKKMPGVWFFSLDASKLIPTLAARLAYLLPYLHARIDFRQTKGLSRFESERRCDNTVRFQATWRTGMRLGEPDATSLAFFLVERYCFFVAHRDRVLITRIHHRPWTLNEATVESYASTMLKPLGISQPDSLPLVYFSSTLPVAIWPPKVV